MQPNRSCCQLDFPCNTTSPSLARLEERDVHSRRASSRLPDPEIQPIFIDFNVRNTNNAITLIGADRCIPARITVPACGLVRPPHHPRKNNIMKVPAAPCSTQQQRLSLREPRPLVGTRGSRRSNTVKMPAAPRSTRQQRGPDQTSGHGNNTLVKEAALPTDSSRRHHLSLV